MTDALVLTGNIETLRNDLGIDHQTLLATISPEERQALRISVERCTLELQRLLYRLITQPLDMPDRTD
jgi:hypothetical protein